MFVVVDRFSKAIVITPCLKSITAEETSQLYLDNVWQRTGLPRTVISDRGPQFTSKVMRETWSKLNIDQALSTAFHPQTNGETEALTKKLNNSSKCSVTTNRTTGPTYSPSQNLPITSERTQLLDVPHSKSGMDSNPSSFLLSTSPPNSLLLKND